MTVRDLYVTCGNVIDRSDVFIHDGGRSGLLSDLWSHEILERKVFAFNVVNGNMLQAYLEKEEAK